MLSKTGKYKFELFLGTQIAILFGSLIIPAGISNLITPVLFYLNVIIGCLFISSRERDQKRIIFFFSLTGAILIFSPLIWEGLNFFNYTLFILFFLFHILITYHIIRLLWNTHLVDKRTIFGMMSGFISLGFIGLFIFLSLELVHPGSFSGLSMEEGVSLTDNLMYFSYITLMTIGYGEILPVTLLAQKATILIGLLGQFYLVILTAIIVGKFLSQ